ncbi:MAG: hypothetical protein OIF40_16520 [Mangrovicoccus sp.]|nr:hypothetical protein [Mangrovicoccus sp.]
MAETARRTQTETRIDAIMRQALMLSDPSNPEEVAKALAKRYRDGALRIETDRTGMPAALASPSPVPNSGPSDAELVQAKNDLDRDLGALVAAPQLKDIQPELQGWQRSLPQILERGIGAARSAVNERHRAIAMAARQELGDYARLARMLGASTPEFNGTYRALAKSIDQAAALILVLAGETIAGRGFGGIAALPVPVADLTQRRDAVITALHDLINPDTNAHHGEDWPRALHALSAVNDWLDRSGQGHLRALLDETYLASILDKLVETIGQSEANVLRGLSATSAVTVAQLNRLLSLLGRAINPASPPLARFRQALQLFLQSFRPDRGRRLILAARPPLMANGFYGLANTEEDTGFVNLMVARSRLAALLDCYLGCDCDESSVACQFVLDKMLYDIDRAIDRYISDRPEASQRAAAFGLLIGILLEPAKFPSTVVTTDPFGRYIDVEKQIASLRPCMRPDGKARDMLRSVLSEAQNILITPIEPADWRQRPNAPLPELYELIHAELCNQREDETRWFEFAAAMTPNCKDLPAFHTQINALLAAALYLAGQGKTVDQIIIDGEPINAVLVTCEAAESSIPAHYETSLDSFAYAYLSREGQIIPQGDKG